MPGKSIVNQSETELRSWILTASHPYAHAVLQLIVHALLDIYACIFTSLVHPSRIDCRRDCCIASRRHQAIDVRICREDFLNTRCKRTPTPRGCQFHIGMFIEEPINSTHTLVMAHVHSSCGGEVCDVAATCVVHALRHIVARLLIDFADVAAVILRRARHLDDILVNNLRAH